MQFQNIFWQFQSDVRFGQGIQSIDDQFVKGIHIVVDIRKGKRTNGIQIPGIYILVVENIFVASFAGFAEPAYKTYSFRIFSKV